MAAAIVTKLGSPAAGLSIYSGSGKLLAVGLVNTQVPKANIYSKTSGMLEPRLKPWDHKKWGFNYLISLFDGTTKRFNDNSKMVIVDGPPALEKSKFAKELADELDMLYVPPATMDDYYINPYGYDLRELDFKFTLPRNKCFDEKNFAQDPKGCDGGLDRMLDSLQLIRYAKYCDSLAHIFNTGQGVVMEKSPYSDYVYTEAAYKQGWIDKESRTLYYKKRENMMSHLMKPNLIVYLDAPIDVVQSKIRARAQTTHPWEKNSPVYSNTAYMKMVYHDMLKNDYLRNAAINSQVLMYDWSEEGDSEVVVEDIERLNMDYHDKYDKQQIDWRLHIEDKYAQKRYFFSNRMKYLYNLNTDYVSAHKVTKSGQEMEEFSRIAARVPGDTYRKGFNEEMGDPSTAFRLTFGKISSHHPIAWHTSNNELMAGDAEYEEYIRKRAEKRAAGEQNWWQF